MKLNWKRIGKWFLGIIVFLTVAFIALILYQTKDEVQATPGNMEEKLQEAFNKDRMAGAAYAVFTPDTILHIGAMGWANREKQVPYTMQQGQYLASIAKTMIGVALLKGQELGLFMLEDPINDHLPFQVKNPAFADVEITILQLANHTSSLEYNEKVIESLFIADTAKEASLERFMDAYFVDAELGAVLFLDTAPATHRDYSNIGAALAAYIIEVTSGLTFDQFCQHYIFNPLNLEQTAWWSQDSLLEYYAADSLSGELAPTVNMGVQLYPVRDLYSTVEDMTTYAQAIMRQDDRILKTESYEQMLSPSLSAEVTGGETDQHGLFWMIDRNQYGIPYSMIGHNGGDYGINTMLWFDPHLDLGYIFIGNTGQSEESQGNHIWMARTLMSLGEYHLLHSPEQSFMDKLAFRWYNYRSRIGGLF